MPIKFNPLSGQFDLVNAVPTPPVTFDDSTFRIYDNANNTKQLAFEVSAVSASTTRTLNVPNASGRIQVEGQAIGDVTPAAGSFTTLTASSTVTLPFGDVGSSASPIFKFGQTSTGFYHNGGDPFFVRNGVDIFKVDSNSRFNVVSSAGIHISTNDAPLRFSHGVTLYPEASGQLHQYEGSQPQQFFVYKTRTSSTNYERGFAKWVGNTFVLGAEKGSAGGTNRMVAIEAMGATRVEIDGSFRLVNASGGKSQIDSQVAAGDHKINQLPYMSGVIQLERNENLGDDDYECESYSNWVNGSASAFNTTDKWTQLPSNSLNWLQLKLIFARANGKVLSEGQNPINSSAYVDYATGSLYYVDYGWGLAPGNYVDFINDLMNILGMSTRLYSKDTLTWITNPTHQLDDFVLIFEETGWIDDGAGSNVLQTPNYFSIRNQDTTLIDAFSTDLGSIGNILQPIGWKQWTRL